MTIDSDRTLVAEPPIGEPVVVCACEPDGESWVAHHRERQQVVGKEHRHVDVQLGELPAPVVTI